MNDIAAQRSGLSAIGVNSISAGKIDDLSIRLVGCLIDADESLAHLIVGYVTGDATPEYRLGHLLPHTRRFLKTGYGVADDAVTLEFAMKAIQHVINLIKADPTVLDRLVGVEG